MLGKGVFCFLRDALIGQLQYSEISPRMVLHLRPILSSFLTLDVLDDSLVLVQTGQADELLSFYPIMP